MPSLLHITRSSSEKLQRENIQTKIQKYSFSTDK